MYDYVGKSGHKLLYDMKRTIVPRYSHNNHRYVDTMCEENLGYDREARLFEPSAVQWHILPLPLPAYFLEACELDFIMQSAPKEHHASIYLEGTHSQKILLHFPTDFRAITLELRLTTETKDIPELEPTFSQKHTKQIKHLCTLEWCVLCVWWCH